MSPCMGWKGWPVCVGEEPSLEDRVDLEHGQGSLADVEVRVPSGGVSESPAQHAAQAV